MNCEHAFSWAALGMGFALGALAMVLFIVLCCLWTDDAKVQS